MNLYVTADRVGIETGGGKVTGCEVEALRSLGPCEVWGQQELHHEGEQPWVYDNQAFFRMNRSVGPHIPPFEVPKLAHFYAGTFSTAVARLKKYGSKITYTADAHDVAKSRQAHLDLGLAYDYPHLTDPVLWKRYLGGYAAADVLIVPSTHSRDVMRNFGCTNRIEIIPHGCEIPAGPNAQFPIHFTVGYLGAIGPDKGIRYLLEAWKKLNYKEAVLLLAGGQSTSPFMHQMIHQFGGGNIQMMGWVKDVADFYNSISVYVQPSITEGFGIEVLEAQAHGRPCLVSAGAGACDMVSHGYRFAAGNVDQLAEKIDNAKKNFRFNDPHLSTGWRQLASAFTWDKIRERYAQLWRELLK